jgi:hypothetical protein
MTPLAISFLHDGVCRHHGADSGWRTVGNRKTMISQNLKPPKLAGAYPLRCRALFCRLPNFLAQESAKFHAFNFIGHACPPGGRADGPYEREPSHLGRSMGTMNSLPKRTRSRSASSGEAEDGHVAVLVTIRVATLNGHQNGPCSAQNNGPSERAVLSTARSLTGLACSLALRLSTRVAWPGLRHRPPL